MNDVLRNHPFGAPHLMQNPRLSPTRSLSTPAMPTSNRKRKADDDGAEDERMSSPSPSLGQRSLPAPAVPLSSQRNIKRARSNLVGRPLTVPRLLETLGEADMRSLLRQLCDRHAFIASEVVATAPKPSVASALEVLHNYEAQVRAAFPFGPRTSSDYAYNRVRGPTLELLDALKDYTPHFLPPNEATPATSLAYLDQATAIIHRLQDWDTYQNNRHKIDAYDEMARAWAVVIQEATKKGSGIQLQYGGWDRKIREHDDISGGKMAAAVEEMKKSGEWTGQEDTAGHMRGSGNGMSEREEIRHQLLNGTFGRGSVQVGPW